MKVLKRILPVLMIFSFLFILTSCGYNFYNDYKSKGAVLDNGDSFKVLVVDDVKKMREENKNFAIIIGTSNNESCVTAITKIQSEFDIVGYKGVAYYLDATEAIKYQSKGAQLTSDLGVKGINPGSDGIIFVEYNGSRVLCDTSKNDEAGKKFRLNNLLEGSLLPRAIADYIVEYYSVEA